MEAGPEQESRWRPQDTGGGSGSVVKEGGFWQNDWPGSWAWGAAGAWAAGKEEGQLGVEPGVGAGSSDEVSSGLLDAFLKVS